MAQDRVKALYFVGKRKANGRPAEYITGVPTRDLSERDIRRLSDDEYEAATNSKLYQKTKPASRSDETKTVSKQEAKPEAKVDNPPAKETEPVKPAGSDQKASN